MDDVCTHMTSENNRCGEEIVEECDCGEFTVCLAGHGEIPEHHVCCDIPMDGLDRDPRGERNREIEEKFLDG